MRKSVDGSEVAVDDGVGEARVETVETAAENEGHQFANKTPATLMQTNGWSRLRPKPYTTNA